MMITFNEEAIFKNPGGGGGGGGGAEDETVATLLGDNDSRVEVVTNP